MIELSVARGAFRRRVAQKPYARACAASLFRPEPEPDLGERHVARLFEGIDQRDLDAPPLQ